MHLSGWQGKIGTGIVAITFTGMVIQELNHHSMDHGEHHTFIFAQVATSLPVAYVSGAAVSAPSYLSFLS
jgi:hypothetical protein